MTIGRADDDIWLESGNLSYLTWGAVPHACPARRPATGTLWSSEPRELPVRFEGHRPPR